MVCSAPAAGRPPPGPPPPPHNPAPAFCSAHDASEKREKGEPEMRECRGCRLVLQTTYSKFAYCPGCSEREKRCVICGEPGQLAATKVPCARMGMEGTANGPGRPPEMQPEPLPEPPPAPTADGRSPRSRQARPSQVPAPPRPEIGQWQAAPNRDIPYGPPPQNMGPPNQASRDSQGPGRDMGPPNQNMPGPGSRGPPPPGWQGGAPRSMQHIGGGGGMAARPPQWSPSRPGGPAPPPPYKGPPQDEGGFSGFLRLFGL